MGSQQTKSGNSQVDPQISTALDAARHHGQPVRELPVGKSAELENDLRIPNTDLESEATILEIPVGPADVSTIIGSSEPTAHAILGGRFKLLETIGEGGMGSVWVAEQQLPVKRKVAIKLIKAGMDSQQFLARFEAERQALAMMDHPHIAKVFDGGMTEQGRPYFVMEYVDGVPFTEYCDQARLSVQDRLNLFIKVCSAVQHAHHKGIVHRDLKPSNILISLHDGKPVPKVIDFGLAKAMHQSLTDHSIHTGYGMMVGTPLYMSPEQADYKSLDVDTRTDIYSLGVVLYELLTGSTPLERQQLQNAALDELLRLIKEVEPIRPSIRLSGCDQLTTIAAQRSIEPKRLCRCLAGDLDWIVLKALEKKRSRRYETVSGLARDIERFLNEEVVEACPPSAAYLFRKFVRKHRGKVLAAGALVLSLVIGVIGTTYGMARAEHYRLNVEDALIKQTQQKRRAEESEAETLSNFRESTDDVIEHLIGSKAQLSRRERAYLERSLTRWKTFASRQGEDYLSQRYQGEGYFRIGVVWFKLGQLTEARTAFEEAIVRQRKLVDAFPEDPDYQHDLAATQTNLGSLLRDLGEYAASRRTLERARDIQRGLTEQFPSVVEYQRNLGAIWNNLGKLLIDLGERKVARNALEQARDIQEKIVEEYPADPDFRQDLAISHCNLGILLSQLGDLQGASSAYEQALAIQRKLIARFPDAIDCQKELARTSCNLGSLLLDSGKRPAAKAAYEQARDLQQELVDQFPADPNCRMDLSKSLLNLGSVLRDSGDLNESRKSYLQALAMQRKLVGQFPGVPEYQTDLATIHNNLGGLSDNSGDAAAAQKEYEQARDIQRKLVERFPAIPEYQRNLAGTVCNLGGLVRHQGRLSESLILYNDAIKLLTSKVMVKTRDAESKLFLRNTYFGRAVVYRELKQFAEAAADWDQCVTLSPPENRPTFRLERADAWMRSGRVAEAVTEVEELIRLGKTGVDAVARWSTDDWYHFVCLYALASEKVAESKAEYVARAIELLRYVVRAGYNTPSALDHMSKDTDLDSLRNREDYKQLLDSASKQQQDQPASSRQK